VVTVIALVVLLMILLAAVFGYLVAKSGEPMPPNDPDPEAELEAAVELHRIRRNLDASWTKTKQRQDGQALRRQIRETLDEADE
jgi:hypothetical protein